MFKPIPASISLVKHVLPYVVALLLSVGGFLWLTCSMDRLPVQDAPIQVTP